MKQPKLSLKPLQDDFQFVNISRLMTAKKNITDRQTSFDEIYQEYNSSQAQEQAHRCIDCGNPYCEWKCPVHNYIPDWLTLVNQGKIIEAAELCHQTNSLPEVCGRICPQDRLCEGSCTLNDEYGAVTIGAIEKHITETAFQMGWKPSVSAIKRTDKKVAVIGAGPAGLACADVLVRHGYTPVVFDRYPEIGGLLTFGIPEFKLEKSVIRRRQAIFTEMGVEFQLNTEVGKDIHLNEIINDFDAVFMGLGAYKPVKGNIPGEDSSNIYSALPYLIGNTCYIHGISPTLAQYQCLKGLDVIVLGGGDTAMDCNRTAIRQGSSKVTCVYRQTETDMPGSQAEVMNAKEEGVNFLFNLQPVAFTPTTHNKIDITFIHKKTRQDQTIQADAVIVAFGFQASPDHWLADNNINFLDNGRIKLNNHDTYTSQTSNPKVFTGGDMVRGSDLVVTAIADGRTAAEEIIQYLG